MKLTTIILVACCAISSIPDVLGQRRSSLDRKKPKLKKFCIYNGLKFKAGDVVDIFEPSCKKLTCVKNEDGKGELTMETIEDCECNFSEVKNEPKRIPGKKPKCVWNTSKHTNKELAYEDADKCFAIQCKAKKRKGQGKPKVQFYKPVYTRDCTCQKPYKWSYHGDTGPDTWADNSELCGGSSQSPIDVITGDAAVDGALKDFTFTNYDASNAGELLNNGHSAQYSLKDGSTIPTISGGGLPGTYEFLQYHFHWGKDSSVGSEHLIDGRQFPMEIHFVHWNQAYGDVGTALGESDGLAVLGVMFEISGEDNAAFASLVSALAEIKASGATTDIASVALQSFLPQSILKGGGFYRYQGSLTTPTCNEAVVWTVFKDSLTISETQMEQFRMLIGSDDKLMVDNFRPVLPLNGRPVTQK